jgi:hypothetical protein
VIEHYNKKWERIIAKMPNGGEYNFHLRKYGYQCIVDYIGTGKKVFDYASGVAVLSQMVKEAGNTVTGCDTSDVAIKWCKDNISKDFYVGEKIEGKYDYIIASQFIEHLKDPIEWINSALTHCNELVIAIPNNFRKSGEHIDMAWRNWDEFYNLFNRFKPRRIDNYPSDLSNAFQHPIFIFKGDNMHPSCREEGNKIPKKEVLKPKKEIKKPKKKKKKSFFAIDKKEFDD